MMSQTHNAKESVMDQKFDTVIVGAGSAGGVLAARLSEDPDRSVLLLDAGPDFAEWDQIPVELRLGRAVGIGIVADEPSTDDNYLWHFDARVNADQQIRQFTRGRLVGGSSAVNGQVFLPGLPGDFARWAAAGNDRWTYDDVAPFYREVVDAIGLRRYGEDEWGAPSLAFYEAARSHGFAHCADDHAPESTGVGPATHNNPDDVRRSTLVTYLHVARSRPNLTIRARSVVKQVLVRGDRAVGVDLVNAEGVQERVEASQVVLTAGSLASPQILMLSGIGPAEGLRDLGIHVVADMPGVGANLGEHPYVQMMWRTREGMGCPRTAPGHPLALRTTSPGSSYVNDIKINLHNYAHVPMEVASGSNGMISSLCGVDLASSRGRLRLSSSSIADDPIVDYGLLGEPDDIVRMKYAVELMLELMRSDEMAPVVEELYSPVDESALEGWIRTVVSPAMHACGTCAMGPADSSESVVDQQGRVHGIEGLWVADASIIPEVPRANLNMTVMMLGERLSSFLR
jgi:choline dehydrogenase